MSLVIGFSANIYAYPFNIVPKSGTALPTRLVPGETVNAYYTVSNTTFLPFTITGNFVQYLPNLPGPNVTQAFTDPTYTDICQQPFALQPTGSVGDSCTLKLVISGPVQSVCQDADDIPHCLFICMSDQISCVGTDYVLNVSGMNSMAYVANNDSSDTISVCTVNNGLLGTCTPFTDPNNTLSFPIDIVINSAKTLAYVANSGNNTISVCPVNTNGTLGACTTQPNFGLNTVFTGLTFNSNQTLLYVTNFGENNIATCQIDNITGSLISCIETNGNDTIVQPDGSIAFNPGDTLAYVADAASNVVLICPVDGTSGTFLVSCTSFQNSNFGNMSGVFATATHVYVSFVSNSTNDSTILICEISGNTLINCVSSTGVDSGNNPTFNFTDFNAINIFIDTSHNVAYIPNGGNNTVSICPVKGDGTFDICTVSDGNSTFKTPDGITVL